MWRHCTSTNHLCDDFSNNSSQLMYFSSITIYLLKSTSSGLLSQKPISWCIFLAYYINVRNIHQLTIFLKKSQIISKNISSLLMYVRHIIYVSKKDTSRGTNSGKLGILAKSFKGWEISVNKKSYLQNMVMGTLIRYTGQALKNYSPNWEVLSLLLKKKVQFLAVQQLTSGFQYC